MNEKEKNFIRLCLKKAEEVLIENSKGPYQGLPRTAGDGYPEPYTRDLMISSLGICSIDNDELIDSLEKTLIILAKNQTEKGLIPSLVCDKEDLGSSDTTALFLLALNEYRKKTKGPKFLKDAEVKALRWLSYQSPDDSVMIGQLPTTDWRDEEWVLGYGIYVNSIYYDVLKRYRKYKEAKRLKSLVHRFEIKGGVKHRHIHEGLKIRHKPYYAEWAFKVMASERFDLVGNSLAIISGLCPKTRAKRIIDWVEDECEHLREKRELKGNLPPVLFPFIKKSDPDWIERYEEYNQPGTYHNGGVWPFACGLYVSAIVKTGKRELAEKRLHDLAKLNNISRNKDYDWGFSEWFKSKDLTPSGASHQSWSASMFIYAVKCFEKQFSFCF
jgi:hypothetical protein